MRTCRLVIVSGDGDEAALVRALEEARPDETLLVVATGEAGELTPKFIGRCDFVHLLPGDFLFGQVSAVRDKLAQTDLAPAEQSEVTAAVIYGNLRYYDPVKSYLVREGIEQLRVPSELLAPKKRRPLAAEWTVLAAARALHLPIS